jgi:signal transduction histidine kinase
MASGTKKKTTRIYNRLSVEQIGALRQVCERLGSASRTSTPTELTSLNDIIAVLTSLSEVCSERMKAEPPPTESKQVQQELQNLEKLKGRFMRNVSHELRTPLASIDGFARALLRMEQAEAQGASESTSMMITPETRRQFLSIISQEAQRLGKLIEDVLDFSEIEGNRTRREPTLFCAREVVVDALSSFSGGARTLEAALRLTPEPNGPMIYADRDAMIEVLRQLLINAQKFSAGQEIVVGADEVSISPNIAPTAGNSGHLPRVSTMTRLYVRDRGIGIPKEELTRIFHKFHRIERPGFTVPGTGLGLSIVRELVHQNNGQVWAESEEARGSTFYVMVPNKLPGMF